MDFFQTLYEIARDICRPIARCFRYARSLPKKFTELNERLTNLCQRRADIEAELVRVNQHKAPTSECNSWIANVGKIEAEVKRIEEQHLVNKRCLKGCFPDVIAQARLCEDVEKMIKNVEDLHEKSKFEAGFLTDLPLAKVEKIPLSDLSIEASTTNTLQKIFEHVEDGATQKIGIWGMGGIGKTTLLKLLNNMPEIMSMFQVVIWVTVTQSWTIRKVQDEVADRLSLKVEKNQSDGRVATRLLHELEGKNFLLLLDDVWEFIDLDVVGIPPTNQNNGCKVVLTTRDSKVCWTMKTGVEINVKALPDEEAWKMFESIVGDFAMSRKIQPIAQEIVQKCGGLPLALKVLGVALRKEEDVSVWRNLLRKLKLPDSSYVKDISYNVFAFESQL